MINKQKSKGKCRNALGTEVCKKVEEGGRARYEPYGSYQGARPTKNQ
jgi:hypothetical protein